MESGQLAHIHWKIRNRPVVGNTAVARNVPGSSKKNGLETTIEDSVQMANEFFDKVAIAEENAAQILSEDIVLPILHVFMDRLLAPLKRHCDVLNVVGEFWVTGCKGHSPEDFVAARDGDKVRKHWGVSEIGRRHLERLSKDLIIESPIDAAMHRGPFVPGTMVIPVLICVEWRHHNTISHTEAAGIGEELKDIPLGAILR